jgi:pimeloyl-ACP methyl ester carboxylesterase
MKIIKWTGIILAAILVILVGGPFLIPVPPLEDANRQPEDLADPDSLFIEVNGLRVHYKVWGEGEPVIILLHGFGASTFSWREVAEPLTQYGTVIAYDRPAFGLTERPMPGEWTGENPYSADAQVALLFGLMDELGVQKAILVGNSAGGTVATLAALEHPERVTALVEVDAAIYEGGGVPAWIKPLLSTPQLRHLGPLVARRIKTWGLDFLRSAWHNPDNISPEVFEGYQKYLTIKNWDRALWELTAASSGSGLEGQLNQLLLPVLVVTGDDDRIVPTANSIRLSQDIPQAQLAVIPSCGHVPQEECPEAFMNAVGEFIRSLQ